MRQEVPLLLLGEVVVMGVDNGDKGVKHAHLAPCINPLSFFPTLPLTLHIHTHAATAAAAVQIKSPLDPVLLLFTLFFCVLLQMSHDIYALIDSLHETCLFVCVYALLLLMALPRLFARVLPLFVYVEKKREFFYSWLGTMLHAIHNILYGMLCKQS